MQVLKLKAYTLSLRRENCFHMSIFTDVSETDISVGLFSRLAKNREFTTFKTVKFSCSILFLKAPFVTTVLSPFCVSFHSLPSHIFSSCLLVYPSYFSSALYIFLPLTSYQVCIAPVAVDCDATH